MPVYLTRAERLNLSFPVIFSADGDILRGSCRNISLSGLSAGFARPPEVWINGALAIQTAADRQAVASLVAFAAANTQLTGNPPR